METKDIMLLAVTLVILGEVTFLLAKLPKTSIKTKSRAILVDTSVLMDGRITSVAATGFIGGTLVIPRSVVGELQFLADNADADKRARARRGLDVVSELQHMDNVDVEILQDGSKADEGVDERLLNLAKQHHAVIMTLDFNLNKVAAVEDIIVLNINELAQSLRMAHLPGEHMMIELTQKGQDGHQAVGHLADGTMVVVEQSSAMIGQTVLVEIVRSLQTAAGKMMFAKRVDAKSTPSQKKTPAQTTKKAKTTGRLPAKQVASSDQVEGDRGEAAKSQRSVYHATRQNSSRQKRPSQPSIDKHPDAPQSARRPQRRRKDHEADLIALVEKQ